MARPDAKRVLDLAIGVPAFVVLLPVQALIGLLVRRQLGRPVLFDQRRPGLHGKPFTMRKFRSMLPVDEALGHTDDASRMTDFGRVLRTTSLDELPTLWNVIRGDMSLVGPRPLLMKYLPLYTRDQAKRHQVRPGVTGLAQVSGRNSLTWNEKFVLDTKYVENMTLWLDIKIMALTVVSVAKRDGISSIGAATMDEFEGD